jgi:TolA-binding protein
VRVVDLHPEELIEKAALGSLDAGEKARLDAHLAHCAACRFEQQLRADFASELEDEIPFEKMVGLGVLGLEEVTVVPPARASSVLLRGPRRRRTRAVWLLAAAALLVGGAAAAAMGLAQPRWIRSESSAPVPVSSATAVVHAKAHHVAAPVVEAAEIPEPSAAPAPPSVPVTDHAIRPAAVAPPSVVGPGELFDAENDARRRGDYGRAIDVARDLERRYPTSREAQVSRAIVGRLLLERGDPGDALARFDAYLAAGAGPLGEEAMIGRATSLDRLGRAAEATAAWSALLAAYPATPYASHARARLGGSNER